MSEPSKQLVVLAPKDQPHQPKKVYFDCRHRINDREAERQRSPVRINAHLKDLWMRVLGNKSPIRKVRGLESTAKSNYEYVPSKTKESTYRSATQTRYLEARPISLQKYSEVYGSEEIPSPDPVIRLLFQKVQKMEKRSSSLSGIGMRKSLARTVYRTHKTLTAG
ncbi:unnamed protein product [Prunus armeniaca]